MPARFEKTQSDDYVLNDEQAAVSKTVLPFYLRHIAVAVDSAFQLPRRRHLRSLRTGRRVSRVGGSEPSKGWRRTKKTTKPREEDQGDGEEEENETSVKRNEGLRTRPRPSSQHQCRLHSASSSYSVRLRADDLHDEENVLASSSMQRRSWRRDYEGVLLLAPSASKRNPTPTPTQSLLPRSLSHLNTTAHITPTTPLSLQLRSSH